MELFRTTEHLGLKTALPQPPGNSAKALSNFVRHPHNGWLEQADGYGPKFTLPASDTYTTLISISDIHNFYVKEHGGQQITVCVGTYKKKYRHAATLTPTRVGIWVSHTWSGSAWVEAWVELTQVEYFALTSIRDISGSSYVDLGADYSGAFPTDYFQNWIITFVDYSEAEDHDNYLLCTGNIVDTSKSCLKFFGNSSDLVARSAGALVIVTRNFFGADTPSSLSSHIFSLYNEIRVTTGNTASDMNFMVGYRDKDFGWATPDAATDKLIAEQGCLDIWRYAFGFDSLAAASSTTPVDAGSYELKSTIAMDDGNETELRNPMESQITPITLSNTYVSSDYANCICTDGTYIYIGIVDSGVPKVIKINPLTNLEVSRVAVNIFSIPNAYDGIGVPLSIAVSDGVIYFCVSHDIGASSAFRGFGVGVVSTDSFTSSGQGLVVHIGGGSPTLGTPKSKMIYFGGYLYVTFSDSGGLPTPENPRVYKIDPSLTVTSFFTSVVGGTSEIESIAQIGVNIIVGYDTSPAKIEEIDVSTMVLLTSRTLSAGQNIATAFYVPDSSTVIIGCSTTPAIIIKYNWATGAQTSEYTLATGEDLTTDFNYDGTYLFISVGTASTKVVKFDLATMLPISTTLSVSAVVSLQMTRISGFLYVLSSTGVAPTYIYQINTLSNSYVVIGSGQAIQFKPIVSAGALPKRARKLKIYVSSDNGVFFYLIKEVNLLATVGDVLSIAWDAAAYYNTYLKHFYHRGETITINGDDFAAIGALSSVVLGRDSADDGVINYKNGTIVGNSTYVSNALIGSPAVNEVNKVVVCAVGEGVPMVDVFPNDVANVIDVEYSDGDQIVGSLPLADRLFVIKKRSLVLITNTSDGFERDQVAQGVGCCSIKTAKSLDDINYFCDYNGIYSYSTGALRLLNGEWLLDWKAYTVAQKEAAFAVIDTINRKYIVSINGVQYAYDIDSGVNGNPGEWMSYSWANAPLQFAANAPDATNPGPIDFLTSAKIENLSKATFQDSQDFTMTWDSNEINALAGKEGYAFDVLMQHIVFEYQSDVAITATIYLDGSATALQTITLEAAYTKKTVLLPLSSKCKTYRVKYSAITTGATQDPTPYAVAQAVKIKSRIDYFTTIPAGGDVLSI